MSNLIWYVFPVLIVAALLISFGGDAINRIQTLESILKKKGAPPTSTGEKKSADMVKKNGLKMLGVFIVLLLVTYIFLDTAPTQLPAWRWAFYLILSSLIAYGGNLGKSIGTAILLLVVIVGGWATVFGTDSIKQKFEYLRSIDSGDRSVFTQSAPRLSSLCGADKFIEERVDSTVTPVRFHARLLCPVFAPRKSLTASLMIRYNDGPWETWTGNTTAPEFMGTVRYMDVLGAGTVRVQFGL